MTWIACELHTHTLHSDGRQTLRELAEGAAKLGFGAIALTDHNTMSGLAGKADIEREFGLTIIPGMEWTTFYGHMVTIGLSEFADWRQAGRSDIDRGIAEVHRLGGIAGLAHPFRIGSPACTGCFWEYEVGDWNAVDYVEVWSGTFPSIKTDNRRAFGLWTDKLNEGYRIAATSGRDWHAQEETDEPVSVTYLEIEDEGGESGAASAASPDSGAAEPSRFGAETQPEEVGRGASSAAALAETRLIEALRQGRVSVTIGPLLTMALESGGELWSVGSSVPARVSARAASAAPTSDVPASVGSQGEEAADSVEAAAIRVKLSLDFSVRRGLWTLDDQVFKLKLHSNLGEELSLDAPFKAARPEEVGVGAAESRKALLERGALPAAPGVGTAEEPLRLDLEAELPTPAADSPRSWLRAELWGTARGAYTRIAFTNAVYFEHEEGKNRL
ncbi:CehA/McbA family metallohydrolase [Saccharibacillus alkalitolerans]|uniref:CehA/McbA family metallohydrolase n=1 Tax=Saccharibacillus alkalitolerans TaxID=2705290 RepID=A0ABX0FE36_9BACL|nr:CehA/McbA family metallohydrolase [Saccharibacillus alkalitolerans]NGZ76887.1 CehA/McbA family metallohydrolase [Saccharibacillus alkalitolerans]